MACKARHSRATDTRILDFDFYDDLHEASDFLTLDMHSGAAFSSVLFACNLFASVSFNLAALNKSVEFVFFCFSDQAGLKVPIMPYPVEVRAFTSTCQYTAVRGSVWMKSTPQRGECEKAIEWGYHRQFGKA